MSDWKGVAVVLADAGDMSWRKIAKMLDKPKSSVSDFLREHYKKNEKLEALLERKPKWVEEVKSEDDLWDELLTSANYYKGFGAGTSKPKLKGKAVFKNETTLRRKNRHVVIADTQARDDVDLTYMSAIGQYIADKQPEKIIHIGDHYDFPSLSSYDKGKRSFEGRRLIKDLAAGEMGLKMLMQPIYDLQDYQVANGLEVYDPEMVVTLGNHEDRLTRLQNDMPEFEGFLGDDPLKFEEHGWKVYPFLTPAYIDGIAYIHFMPNPFSGKPYGGSAMNILKNVGHSFVVGHKQSLDIAIRPIIGGKMQLGIVNGACYPHDEDYKGNTGNNHFRGITVLNEVEDGYGDPMFVSLEYIMDKYK